VLFLIQMDSSLSKNFKTSRGINYHYYYAPPKDGKITLFFAHGFPSNADSWHNQASFFRNLGYGVLVPDVLGFGETDKPMDADSYRFKYMVVDITEIFDHENVEKVIAIGHDWGATLVSRLASYYHDDARFLAFAFFAVSYRPPSPDFDIEAVNATSKQLLGYEVFGYWFFFAEDENAGQIIQEHSDSFFSLAFAADPSLWQDHFAPRGELKKWLLEDKMTVLDDWAKDPVEFKIQTDPIRKHGVAAGVNWYKGFVNKLQAKDDADIPKEKYVITKPTFFGAASKDVVCIAALGKRVHAQLCPNTTIVDFDTGHWVQNALPDKVNEELLKWIKTVEA